MADENKPAFYPRVGRTIAKNFRSAQPPAFIEDPRAMELPRLGEDSDQFGRIDLSVPSRENLELGRRLAERDAQLRRQREADRSPLEKLAGGVQAGRLIGSGLVQSVASIPTAITKGGKAAEEYIAENMYKPTQPLAYEYAQDVGDFLEKLETQYKIPPILPEAVALQYLTGPATAQATRAAGKGAVKAGMELERRMEPVVRGALEQGGLPREMVMAMGANTQSNVMKPSLRVVAPQMEALRLAQKRAALPIEKGGLGLPPNNTAEQRAAAMGFDSDTYHGTFRDIQRLDPSSGSTESHAGRGIYSTDVPEDAGQNYASIYGPDVSARVTRGLEERDKDFRKIHGRMRDENLTPRQQEIILRNTIGADNLGVVYPLRVRSDKSIHLDAPEEKPVRIGPFEKYDEAADAYVDTPHTATFNEALDEFRGLGGEANPIYDLVQDYGDASVPARDVFNVVKKTGNESGLYDPDTGDIVSGGVAAGDFVKHFGIDEIRHTPQFRNRELNIGTEHTISLDPDNVRSRFAAFDPYRRSAAIAAAMGVAAPDLLAKEKKSEKKKSDGGKVSISNNPDAMMLELNNKRMKKGGSEDDTKPFFGGAGTKKYAAAKKRAEQADVNTLKDPRTYAAVAGLLGEAPDQMGFSVLHPDYQAIKDVAEPAFGLGIAAQAYPVIGPLTKGLPVGASIKNVTPMKASEALGKIEGRPLKITQADRTKVGGGYLGGPGFSGLQLTEPEYRAAEAAWAVQNAGTAKTILGGGGDNAVYAAMLGTPTQHQSNQMVFDKLLGDFRKAAKRGELTPELRDLINMRLASAVDKNGNPVFPADVDIMDKKFRDVADTFSRRSIAGHLMGGVQVGGKKGQIIDYDKIIRSTTDPALLDQPTGALGNRLFTLSGGIIQRPDLHPAFPTILQGEDLGVMFTPVERDIVMKDFVEKTMREKGRKPGYMDYTRGNPPTQLITEDILTELQKLGKKKGGAVKKAEGGYIKKPAAYLNGDEFVNAAKKYGIKDSMNNLNKIVDLVNKGLSVDDAARQVADSGTHKAAGGAIRGDDLILEERPL